MMSVIRAFIAVNLTPEIQRRLDELISAFIQKLEKSPVRWVPANNIHLTLKFLGDVSLANLDLLKKLLRAEIANYRPFEISVGGAGAFPTVHRPRVIWVGVEAPPELAAVQASVEGMTARLGYAPEERPFSPHLTLGRVSRNTTPQDCRAISAVLDKEKVGFLGALCVQSVELYKSDLHPLGPVYTNIFSAPLGGDHR
jgi:2'-5' RNA ligase